MVKKESLELKSQTRRLFEPDLLIKKRNLQVLESSHWQETWVRKGGTLIVDVRNI